MEREIYRPGLRAAKGLVPQAVREDEACDLENRIICYARSDAGIKFLICKISPVLINLKLMGCE